MDIEFWASRVHPSKNYTSMQAARLNSETHLNLDDSEGDEDMRVCFPCPFCYMDIELPALCSHLQEEHCFDVKNAVCPVCAANLGRDMIGHFTVQHVHLLKRRRKSQRVGTWTNTSQMLGKELRDLGSFLGANNRGKIPDSAPDPLLSPFLCNIALPDTKESQDISSGMNAKVTSTLEATKSTEPLTSDGAREQAYEEGMKRAEFVQQMLLSKIL